MQMLAMRTTAVQCLGYGEVKRGKGLLRLPCWCRLTLPKMLTNSNRPDGEASCSRPVSTVSWSLSDLAGPGSP